MPTLPHFDVNLMTPACVLWESDNITQSLIETDPPTRNLLFESRFDSTSTSASFTLHCPIRLKGIDSHSHILGWIPPRSITSFSFKVHPSPPETVRKKLNCSAVRLRFGLDQPLRLIAPDAATEPVQPRKRLSAEAFDTLRSLATASTLDIYISDRELSHSRLNAIREAVAQTLLTPFDADFSTTLASLYDGRGGKLIDLSVPRSKVSTSQTDEPPAYDELESPPIVIKPTIFRKPELSQTAQLTSSNDKKRRRLDDSSSLEGIENRLDWTMVVEMREEMNRLVKRVEQLEKENKDLSDELDVLRATCNQATDGINADEAALLEVRDDLDELTDRVDFLAKNGIDGDIEETIIEKVTNRAVANILTKNYKLSIEEG